MKLALAEQEGIVAAGEPLAPHTTWKIGGPARWFCRVRTEAALVSMLAWADSAREPVALLGMGSNVLVSDDGFPGIVARLEGEFLRVSVEGERLTAGGGAALGAVCAAAARAGLSGIEAISGIPSSIGAAVRINAGAYGGEIFDVLESARLVSRSGEARTVRAEEIPHGYRWSRLVETKEIVARPALRLERAPTKKSRRRRARSPKAPRRPPVRAQRRKRLQQPARRLRGPPDRGLRPEGGAPRRGGDLSRHANVIVNEGGATATDVLDLMRLARDTVRERFGITLAPEVELLGLKWE